MNCFAHIFIGKEFEQLVQNIGRATYKYSGSAVSYLNYYLLDLNQSAPIFKKLSIISSAPSSELECLDKYIKCEWIAPNIEGLDLTSIYRLNIFNAILGGVNRESHNCLYVCIHFPFYKESAFKQLSTLYQAIRAAQAPDKISFIGYCHDIAEIINPEEKNVEKLAPKSQISAYQKFTESNKVLKNHHLLLFQNAFQNGIPLNLTNQSLVDIISLLITQFVNHYDQFYPDTMADSEMTSFGISTISLDKYRFIDYLFCQTMLHDMDASSIMDDHININEVFAQVRTILHEKEHKLSEFQTKLDKQNIVAAQTDIHKEAQTIIDKSEEIVHKNKSIPMRAALLAALLQTKCDLFHEMIFDPDNSDLNDLYIESIDYFINHDKSHFYWVNANTPIVNPIKEIKELNNRLINSESQIRDLEKSLAVYETELEKSKEVGKIISFSKDGYYQINDKKYRLLPVTDEDPLQETYQSHEIHAQSLDLRANFSEIQDQGAQGSCLTFALTSVFEYIMRSNNRLGEMDLSEAFLSYNARKLDSNQTSQDEDSDSRFKPALDSLYQYGISTEDLYKYEDNSYDKEPSNEAYEDAKKRLLSKALNVSHTISDIKSALEDGYPVVASFTLCPSFSNIIHGFVPMPTKEEIESSKNGQSKHTQHVMVIVGFDDKIQCFLVRNSWGAEWGEQGYCYIPYDYIENNDLLNFACILAKIESIEFQPIPIKNIPTLQLDDTDISIRYYNTLTALRHEKDIVSETIEKRNSLNSYFEHLKQKFSNRNDCQIYIQRTTDKINEEQKFLQEEIKQEQKNCDIEYDKFQTAKKKLIIKTIGYTIGIFFFVWLYNNIIRAIADYNWVKELVGMIESVTVFILEQFTEDAIQTPSIDLYIDWIHYVVILVIFGLFFYKGHRAWKIWRENKSEHERQINLRKKQIAIKQKESDEFHFNTLIACNWLSELNKIQGSIQQQYTNIISCLNNLRSWYNDLKNMKGMINLQSAVPNTTLLNKEILDQFFETNLKNDPTLEIDFTKNLNQHQISDEYLKKYQNELQDEIIKRLISNSRLKEFNITEHIVSETFTDIAQKVSSYSENETISLENVKRQSDIFMHIRPIQRGVIMPSTYVIAPSCQQYEHSLRKKIGHGGDSYLESSQTYNLTMLQIMCLQFNECVIFQ